MPARPLVPILTLAVVLAACGPRVPRVPAPRPAPTRPPNDVAGAPVVVTPPSVPAPVVVAGPAAATAWRFGWTPGGVAYVATTRAAITVEGDTGQRTMDSVTTRAHLGYRVSPPNAPRGVAITVDSFLVRTTAGGPEAPALRSPVVFTGRIDEAGARITFEPAQAMLGAPCSGPELTLLALAREIAAPLPPELAQGARWRDSSSHALCRAGVPLTVTARHEWRVEGEVEVEGLRLVRLLRETEATIAGRGTGRRAGASIDGESRSTAEYLLDATAGRVERVTVASRAELVVRERADAPALRTRQDAAQLVVRVRP